MGEAALGTRLLAGGRARSAALLAHDGAAWVVHYEKDNRVCPVLLHAQEVLEGKFLRQVTLETGEVLFRPLVAVAAALLELVPHVAVEALQYRLLIRLPVVEERADGVPALGTGPRVQLVAQQQVVPDEGLRAHEVVGVTFSASRSEAPVGERVEDARVGAPLRPYSGAADEGVVGEPLEALAGVALRERLARGRIVRMEALDEPVGLEGRQHAQTSQGIEERALLGVEVRQRAVRAGHGRRKSRSAHHDG